MSSGIEGTRILILGGSSGIGLGVAKTVLSAGCQDLVISSKNEDKLENAAAQLRTLCPAATLSTYSCDLANGDTLEDNVLKMFSDLESTSEGRKFHHIVFAAGDPVVLTPLKDRTVNSMIQSGMVRFFAPIVVAKHASGYMHSGPKCSIVFTGGVVAQFPAPGWTFHSSYFAGLEGATRSLAVELKPLRVNLVSPGPVLTDAWENVPPDMRHVLENIVMPKCATGQMANTAETAEAYLYLMRNTAATGSVVRTDSGVSIMPG
ncbi:3-oxoacyl-reductase [Phaeosphaeria sp. MPI-PUGE-AT-0046c]|nr:3-oxoacyl-reductase [Phaeosphaeria sp. MPI-PUGE-AT-0046c]